MVEVALQRLSVSSRLSAKPFIIFAELFFAGLVGLGLTAAGMGGAAWIIGGIVAGAIVSHLYCWLFDTRIQPNRKARKIGQMMIGLTIGLSLQQSNLDILSSQWLFFLGLPIFLMICGAVIGIAYAYIERTDLLTGMLATTPGNIGVMASMAADYSKNAGVVSLIQLMRFTSVILAMPMIANVTIAHPPINSLADLLSHLFSLQIDRLPLSLLVLAVAFVATYLGGKVRIPVAGFFCAIAVGLAFSALPLLLPALSVLDFRLPPLFNLIGQVLLGITIGEYWGINPKLKWSTIATALIPVGLMFGAAFLAAGIARLITHWDWLTCLLVTSPGGSPEMIWIALTLNHNTEIVTAGHLVRLLIINLSLPLLISIACWLDRHFNQPEILASPSPPSSPSPL